ncbi:MAG TPA: bifunctional transaldolase/phosoglucose isomerase [Anaerolineales bacterium]|nr:bifunctional transaldolase/phosoglucose isomerase [Anaerolineales bacterium]
MDNIRKLNELGQSLWMDNIERKLLENGETKALIDRGDIRGMTSNPTIFDKAIEKTHDYDEALMPLAWSGWDSEKIFWELIVEDIRSAADLFLPLYEESNGGDGYISIEVSPLLANDSDASAAQAQQLWARVARPNLMVKIPATEAGISAIRRSVAAGININITLIFSLARYAQVMEAYLSGLEDRLAAGHPIEQLASVASFFVSRVDSNVDKKLPEDSPLRGKIGIANAKLAYEQFQKMFSGERWDKLAARGARLQRPLWASTSTKNPAYPDTLYVDNLIGPNTVNTLPPQTLDAARDHARPEITITKDIDQAHAQMEELAATGLSIDKVTDELEEEGIRLFSESVKSLLKTIEQRRNDAVHELGPLADAVAKRVARLEADSFPARFWAHDPTLWTSDPQGGTEVTMRMGWTESPGKAVALLSSYRSFADEVHKAGLHRYLVLGMGGSSLTAEVISSLFGDASRKDAAYNTDGCLAILDSTDPEQVARTAADFPPDQTLYIVASKSGGTAETTAGYDYFWKLSKKDGSHFIATTDENTSLEQLARQHAFRRIFTSDAAVGGRYSALTDFGMVPAALLGIDLERFVGRAAWMARQCGRDIPPARNPGLVLGAVLGEAALAGRDKLTILADDAVTPLANWIEQIVAESSGKDGKGILPVPLEPLDSPHVYGRDRIFVYLRQTGELDGGADALAAAGFPVLRYPVLHPYEAAAEFFRWEVSVPTACHILGVNAFDQPDVQESKDRTKQKIAEYRKKGRLNEGNWDLEVRASGLQGSGSRLDDFVARGEPPDYFAINAYLPRTREMEDELQRLRVAIRERTECAVAAGFGPRFQHSTGQFHKGGPASGLFIQIVSDPERDIEIPNEGMSFGTLIRAQALGDFETLVARHRQAIRVHLSRPQDIGYLVQALSRERVQR